MNQDQFLNSNNVNTNNANMMNNQQSVFQNIPQDNQNNQMMDPNSQIVSQMLLMNQNMGNQQMMNQNINPNFQNVQNLNNMVVNQDLNNIMLQNQLLANQQLMVNQQMMLNQPIIDPNLVYANVQNPQPIFVQQTQAKPKVEGEKDLGTAFSVAIISMLFGIPGLHHFYLGNTVFGVIYLIFNPILSVILSSIIVTIIFIIVYSCCLFIVICIAVVTMGIGSFLIYVTYILYALYIIPFIVPVIVYIFAFVDLMRMESLVRSANEKIRKSKMQNH